MPLSRKPVDIDFDGPASYRITVKGLIDNRYSQNFGGMRISTQHDSDEPNLTIFTGEVKDQAELVGIIDSIYQLHMTILSVENLSKINGEKSSDPKQSQLPKPDGEDHPS